MSPNLQNSVSHMLARVFLGVFLEWLFQENAQPLLLPYSVFIDGNQRHFLRTLSLVCATILLFLVFPSSAATSAARTNWSSWKTLEMRRLLLLRPLSWLLRVTTKFTTSRIFWTRQTRLGKGILTIPAVF